TRDDVLAAHRVPPQLLGVIPANAGGFGDVEKADAVFYRNEIQPLQQRFLAINDWLGQEVVRFKAREATAACAVVGSAPHKNAGFAEQLRWRPAASGVAEMRRRPGC